MHLRARRPKLQRPAAYMGGRIHVWPAAVTVGPVRTDAHTAVAVGADSHSPSSGAGTASTMAASQGAPAGCGSRGGRRGTFSAAQRSGANPPLLQHTKAPAGSAHIAWMPGITRTGTSKRSTPGRLLPAPALPGAGATHAALAGAWRWRWRSLHEPQAAHHGLLPPTPLPSMSRHASHSRPTPPQGTSSPQRDGPGPLTRLAC
jgi:hypothetical protein